MAKTDAPQTLQEAVIYFNDRDVCQEWIAKMRWPDGVACPTCGSNEVTYVASRRLWQCREHHAKRQFSAKKGTIFEDSPISLSKWFVVIWCIANCKNGISSYELARAIGVTQKTGWFLLHRVRLAMQGDGFLKKFEGEIEVDETFIGGKARNMHKSRREQKIKGRGPVGKTAVMGLLERHGKDGHSTMRTRLISGRKKRHVEPEVFAHVERGSTVYTDALRSYEDLSEDYLHGVIDHSEAYVDGQIHTNGCENYWSLLKRGLNGTYVSVEPFHLFRYLDEQAFRFNNRKATDAERFCHVLNAAVGKRLTYNELIGRSKGRATDGAAG